LRSAPAHGAYEGFAHTLIQSGDEEQQVCTVEQFVYYPCGLGIEWSGLVTGTLQERTEGAPDHGVCAEDGYCCGLGVVFHFAVASLA
jgi:hypothetical protein